MLDHVDSRELAEWRAFEEVEGPVDSRWRDEILARILEALNEANFIEQVKGTPEPKRALLEPPSKVPRPHEVNKPAE